jgi:capsular exopolysaccharide synthesis family protein
MREQQIKNQIFLYLFQKREETAISIAAQVATSRLIDTPINEGPVAPDIKSIYLVGFFLGLGIPIGFLLLKDMLDNKIYDKKDIERAISVPFLGEIYKAPTENPIVISKGSRSAIAESFRTLRTNLNFFQTEQNKSDITLITSSISGEGKTFVTINLGISTALAGKKTILLGFDLRKPKLDGYLSDEKSPRGLSNYLIGDASLDELILSLEGHENLYYIPSGPIPPNPAELILTDRTKVLIETLKERYDHIIIDTAPVGLVADPILLSSYANKAVVVIRHAYTLKNLLPPLQELYTSKKISNMSVLLNGVKRGSKYGNYRYGYGYGYGYGEDYYETDSKKVAWWKFWKS